SAADLVPGDSNSAGDAFVHTWQPTLSNGTTEIPPLQAGDSTIVNVPVQITGFGPVVLGAAIIGGVNGADFSIEGSTCDGRTFYAGDTCAVSIRFAPTAVGTRTATVSITSDQLGGAKEVRTLTGTATATGPKSAAGDTTRTSRTNAGGQSPDGGSQSMISGNGRWQVFTSTSPLTGRHTFDPTPTDGNTPQEEENIFVRDLADPQHTVQVSLHTDFFTHPTRGSTTASRPIAVKNHPSGVGASGASYAPSISSNGRFVSFYTNADDIVPPRLIGAHDAGFAPDHTLVVCDRDPSGKKDSAGNPRLDLLRPKTKVPDYVCYPVESGSNFGDSGMSSIESTTARLAGNGTRITWIESDDSSNDRVRVTTLSPPGGGLKAPANFSYVPSTIPNFLDSPTRINGETTQRNPAINENGNLVVFTADACSDCATHAVIETNLATGTSVRMDAAPGGGSFLGDTFTPNSGGGHFESSTAPAISDTGNRVAFAYQGPAATDHTFVYVATLVGNVVTTVLASRDNAGNPGIGFSPALSGDGRYLAFEAGQPNMHNGVDPPNGQCFTVSDGVAQVICQIVARDLVKDAATLAADQPWVPSEIVSSSITTTCVAQLPPGRVCASAVENPGAGQNSSAESFNPSIDATGSEIAFDSDANNIVTGDTNVSPNSEGTPPAAVDAFVHTWRPALVTTPAFDFGTVDVGKHSDKTFTATEQGFGPISLGKTSIAGPNPVDYQVLSTTCTGKTLNDTQQCKVALRFAPVTAGTRKATLSTVVGKNGYPRHNPPNTISYDPALIRTLTGTGKGRDPVIVVKPTTVDFGSRLPEAPGLKKTIKVSNTGLGPLTINDVVVFDTTHPGSRGDYTVDKTGCAATVPIGGSCTITVTFVGHAVGRRDAVLVITGTAPGGPKNIGLLANVPKPTLSANPGVAQTGRVTTVSGVGFAPNRAVKVGFKGTAVTIQATADSQGRFSVGLVILARGEGGRTITAQSQGVDPSIQGDRSFLVVVGTVNDLVIVNRH
ncbi:MAG: hypothetical protein JWR06_450, partial [Jatrophihabitans sp.]|nr:hypothetical protein [Jatrophihabitans sp.]